MNMKKILVVGGGDYQTPLIKRINEMGYESLCVDRNPDAPGFKFATSHKCIDVLDMESCLTYAKENNIDAVMSYGATLTLPTVSYIADKLNLPALPYETAKLSTNKYLIKKRLAEGKCNIFGDFFELKNREEAKKQVFDFPCVVKPCDGSGSKGVSLVNNQTELENALDYAFKNARYGNVYKESLIDGDEYTVEAFVHNKNVYVYAIIKTTFVKSESGEIDYGHRVPSGLSRENEILLSKEVEKAVAALQINMASVNFDIILSRHDNKPYIIDCGIRVGQNLIASHIVPLSRGVNIMDNTIMQALGENFDAAPKRNRCIATRLLIYKPGTIVEIKNTKELIGTNNIVDIVLRKKVGDRQNKYREKSDSCGWVITTGNTPDEAEANARIAKDLLKDFIIISNDCRVINCES